MQRKNIKSFFTSRWGREGRIMEADYSQLEIRVLAELSGDRQLKQDLDSGADLHLIRASEWLRKPQSQVTKEERRLAKTISFQLQYGASAGGIAKKNSISLEEAHAFINAANRRYPDVETWQAMVYKEVENSRTPSSLRTKKGKPAGVGFYTCPITQRKYTFVEKDGWQEGTRFYAPEIKNYPVQGLATGVMVPVAIGRLLRRRMLEGWESKIINTVHDSVILDCKVEEVEMLKRSVKTGLEALPLYFKEDFGYELIMKYPVDIKVGKDWYDMEEDG